MGPLIGALLGGGASGIFGGAGGGGLMGGLMGKLLGGSGGLGGLISNLFGGGQQAGASDQTNQLLGDIKDMLGQLLEQKGGGQSGGSDGVAGGGHDCGPKPMPEDGHGCGGSSEPSCGGGDQHGCDDAAEPSCGSSSDHCGDVDDSDGDCGGKPTHDCGGADEPEWDGKDKSPSLDRERGAARLLDQAKNTDDPEQKRELINMAMEMLGDGMKEVKGPMGIKFKVPDEGNSYDRDIVDQAHKMLDQIDNGNLDCCNKSEALDSVIDMLKGEGGVDGKPASSDANGDGRRDIGDYVGDRPMPFHHHHGLHDALFHDH